MYIARNSFRRTPNAERYYMAESIPFQPDPHLSDFAFHFAPHLWYTPKSPSYSPTIMRYGDSAPNKRSAMKSGMAETNLIQKPQRPPVITKSDQIKRYVPYSWGPPGWGSGGVARRGSIGVTVPGSGWAAGWGSGEGSLSLTRKRDLTWDG